MYSSETTGDGLEAITNYKVIKENSHYSMVYINLETGRKNQIRVHMKDLGHSVAGDKKYGAATNPLKRLGLHACKLELKNPVTGKLMTFESLIPASFNAMFKKTV
jgi:23S rRNA pseudouridine1911/1915/1917 synthase